MKNFNLLSKMCSPLVGSQSSEVGFDYRLTVGSPSGFNSKWMLKLVSVLVLILTVGVGNAWGDATLLFQETFGVGNGSKARDWDMEYAVQSGVSAVYSSASYTVSGAKQTKNSSDASLNNSTNNTEATFIVGPLDVSSYESLSVQFDWQAGTTAGNTYYAKLYYATSSGGDYTEITKTTGTNTTTFSTQTFSSISSSAQVSTLYLKVAWKSQNVATMIDNFKLYGEEVTKTLSSISITTDPTKTVYLQGETFDATGAVVTATYSDESTSNVTASTTWSPTTLSSTGSQTITATYSGKTATTTITVYSVTISMVGEDESTVLTGAGIPSAPTRTGTSINADNTTLYGFKKWVISGASLGSAATTKGNTITSPTGNVTLKAVYNAPRTVTWMVDGAAYTPSGSGGTDGTAAVQHGKSWSTLTLPTDPTPSCGNKFMGWTTTNIGSTGLDKDDDAAAITALDLMDSSNQSGKTGGGRNINSNITFYAVFADYAE